ncbi:hypothetical protein M409DRAFT_22932 [Zasmidium cellare ATCC 36951]|uniref:Flavoprotein domain-containing protein n=1 Tax=Zasmidium cellare ATCC 36951 TaxID=1080233 RepID=A0A6A6CMB2_ZASCE|nr:uncharacterized protein M409DRAFT_22932 [Zasmidium cellare ATCC 36951]KAF2166879.1 hypothetical protein M409DRAFT_22932 [Zasmidium cellare ATCC 36951]
MEMPETDKALAQLLRAIPYLIMMGCFFAAITYIPSRREHEIKLQKLRLEAQNPKQQDETPKPSPQTSKNNELPHPPPLKASDHLTDAKHHLLLAATGSVATIKLPNILHALSHHPNLSIRILLTPSATTFLQSQSPEQPSLPSLLAIPNVEAIYRDEDEWLVPWTRGAPILHIELRRWADLLVIAPLSANSLAKISLGLSSDLVSSVVRAWDSTGGLIDKPRPGVALPYGEKRDRKGILVAPAMNTAMWNHPVTARHLAMLEEWSVEKGGWIEVLRPIEKDLACGDMGGGAMKEWKDIVGVIEERLGLGSTGGEEEYVAIKGGKLAK